MMASSEDFVDQLGVTAVNAAQLEQTLLQKVYSVCTLLQLSNVTADSAVRCVK